MSDQNTRGKLSYELPILVRLGDMAKAYGYCRTGSGASDGDCTNGVTAASYCTAGTSAGTACTAGNVASSAACTAGTQPGA